MSASAAWEPNAKALLTALDAADEIALHAALTDEDSLAARWLATLTDADSAKLVSCVLRADGAGLAPIITVSMGDWALTEGCGDWTDPYR